jgi:serine O-acetyltransferase
MEDADLERLSGADGEGNDFGAVVEALHRANEQFMQGRPLRRGWQGLPSRQAVAQIFDDLRAVLFPHHFGTADVTRDGGRFALGARLDEARRLLGAQVRRGLSYTCRHQAARDESCAACDLGAATVTAQVLAALPRIRALLGTDVQAAYDGDPAAKFVDETLFCYPGVTALIAYRIAHELYARSIPIIPRMLSELAHTMTGIDIHPGAEIGESFFIDHGTGVVVGETCTIGNRVRIYQSVTLGARGFPSDPNGHPLKGLPRHPVVEDDVTIYAGATILGRITIGAGAVIGGNVWLTHSVAPGARFTQSQTPTRSDGGG